MGELTAQIAAYLRPSYDQAIAGRQTQTQRYGTDLDVDAASRGMGRSSYVTDAKSKLQQAEAADISNLESNYGAALSEALLNQYNQHLANKLNTDTINAQLRAQLEQSAYDRAGDMYNLTKKKGSGGSGSDEITAAGTATYYRWQDYINANDGKTAAQKKKELNNLIGSNAFDTKQNGKGIYAALRNLLY
jgi:predicted RNA-binding protein YlxR (DUF448 family)